MSDSILARCNVSRLTDILICELMRQADSLRLMFDRTTIDNGVFELLHNSLVNGVTLSRIWSAMLGESQSGI